MVEIIWVAFIPILQLVEEVEDVESECCRRTFDRRRKPAATEELNTFGRRAVTVTVPHNEAVCAREVENHQVMQGGRAGTGVTSVVS